MTSSLLYEDAEHHERDGYGQATVEEAHISSNPIIGDKWTLNDNNKIITYFCIMLRMLEEKPNSFHCSVWYSNIPESS